MRVMFFGTYDVQRHPRVGVLREGLEASGVQVEECNAPLGVSTRTRVKILKRPWLLPALGVRLVQRWIALWRCARHEPPVDLVVVGYMGHFDVHLARPLFRQQQIALDFLISGRATAIDRGTKARSVLSILGHLDRSALRRSDIPIVDTEEHLQDLPADQRSKALVVEVGAPYAWFQAGEEAVVEGPELKVIFFGLYTPLQGTITIGQAINRCRGQAEIGFTMVGSGQDLAATQQIVGTSDQVTWIDWVSNDELPNLVATHHVCLGIFGTGPKAMKVVPNKVFQGAAAGCAVVTSDTPPQRRALDGAAELIPAGDADVLTQTLVALAHDGTQLRHLRSAAKGRALERFTPVSIVRPLLERARTGEDPSQGAAGGSP